LRVIIVLFIVMIITGCATINPDCYKLKEFIFADAACESGYINVLTAITGHPAECLLTEELERIQKECSNWR
jgi:hypothetical protein